MELYIKTFLVVAVILALCFVGLGIQIFWGKRKRFPQYEVGDNEEMRKRGIYCMNYIQQMIDREIIEGKRNAISHEDCNGCALQNSNCSIRAYKLKSQAKHTEE